MSHAPRQDRDDQQIRADELRGERDAQRGERMLRSRSRDALAALASSGTRGRRRIRFIRRGMRHVAAHHEDTYYF